MAFPFKIPKKKNSGGSDSAHQHLQSPLSRLQSHAPQLKGYGSPLARGGASRMHAGSSWNSLRPPFRQAVQSLLGLGGPEPAANQGAAGGGGGQSQPGPRGPKRASHRLLPPEPPQKKSSAEEPPQKKSSAAPPPGGLSVAAGDALLALRAQVHAGSPPAQVHAGRPPAQVHAGSPPAQVHAGKPPAQVHAGRPPSEPPQKKKQAPLELKRDGWRRFQEGRNQNPRPRRAPRAPAEPRGSPRNPGEPIVLSSEEEAEDGEQKGGGATEGEQKGGGATGGEQKGGGATDGEQKGGGATEGEQKGGGATDGEQKGGGATEGEQKGGGATDGEQKGGGATDGERKGGGATDGERKGGGATDGERKGGGATDGEQKGGGATDGEQKGGGATDGEQKGGGATDGEQKGGGATDGEQKGGGATDGEQKGGGATDGKQKGGGATDAEQPDARGAPKLQASFLQLDFVSLHAGLLSAPARGPITVTASGITIPVKGLGLGQDGEVTVVASQVRGYGVWDGGVAKGGSLLTGWEGPAPSLLFLWVSQAQSRLLHRELHQACSAPGPGCCCVLILLREQLPELQAGLLASILDMEEYRRARASPSPSSPSSPPTSPRGGGGPASPLGWADGLLLVHSCPPPVDRHLLRLLGRSPSLQLSVQQKSVRQQLPSRLFQYPPAPCRGRISVTREDLACLETGEFLNDVIIDFYLKYLLLEGAAGPVAQRSHVFSSFFFRQLSRRRAPGEDPPSVPDRLVRHRRVKNWTRNQDIFTKDFLFVPVNREAHWFLVVICFPGLEGIQHEDFQSPAGAAAPPKTPPPPDCTEQGCRRNRVMKRPCILVLDSLKLSNHESVCNLLRDYLQVEWEERRGRPRPPDKPLPPDKPRPLDKPRPPDKPLPPDRPRPFIASSFSSSRCRVPQQDNSSDCGLFLLQNAESFLQNPVVHFELPPRLERWFPRRRAQQKREEIRRLIRRLQREEASPR